MCGGSCVTSGAAEQNHSETMRLNQVYSTTFLGRPDLKTSKYYSIILILAAFQFDSCTSPQFVLKMLLYFCVNKLKTDENVVVERPHLARWPHVE